jgi:hypothetical protein
MDFFDHPRASHRVTDIISLKTGFIIRLQMNLADYKHASMNSTIVCSHSPG